MGPSYQRLASAIGVTRVARLTELDRTGVEVASAMRPSGHILQVSNGKGRDFQTAALGAVHEAAELWASEQPLVGAIDAEADELEAMHCQWLGGRPDPLRCKWVQAQRLEVRGTIWVPASAVSCPPTGPGPVMVPWTSNAMGAHAQLGAALLHALYEAWEREALAQVLPDGWRPRELGGRRLEWRSAALAAQSFEVAVFDLTPDGGVAPVAGALLRDLEEGPIALTAGYASRPSLRAAIEAAVLEAAQSRQTEIQAAREDVVVARTLDVPALWAEVKRAKRSRRAAVRGPGTPAGLARRFERPVAIVELAKGRLPIHVVKVLVPGFRVSELLQ